MMIKSVFLRTIAVMLTAVMMLTLVGTAAHQAYDVKDPDTCKLNFTVISDSHIEGNNIERYKVFATAVKDVQQNKSGNDAVVFLGDNTMNGQHIENLLFHGAAYAALKDENVLPVLGNHDIGNGEGDYARLQSRWYDYSAAFFGKNLSHPYYYEVIEGCYFIVLGMETQEVHEMYMSEAQFSWLEDVLAQAAQSGMPVFVFCHYPSDYVVDDEGNETGRLTEMLAAYNEEHDLFSFVGHTHMPMHFFWSFHTDDGFPETYLPRITSLGGANDSELLDDTGVGVEVELYENEVVIRCRDFYRGEWKIDQWEDDEPLMEVTYQLKNPVPQA